MINETYSAFVQGFMPTLARPEVDLLEGLTTAIIVDQERMGANPRSTVGTATDANAMLRILFSRLGKPHIGPPTAFSFNVPTRTASGVMSTEKAAAGSRRTSCATWSTTGGMCPRCEGMGSVNDFDLTALYDDTQVARPRARSRSPATAWTAGTAASSAAPAFDMDKPIGEVHQEGAARPALQGADQDQGRGHQPHLRGRDPEDPEVDAVQGRRRDAAAHPRASSSGRSRSRPAPTATAPGSARRPGRRRSTGKNIADVCAMQISDLADWVRGLDEPSVAPLLAGLQHLLDSFAEIGLGYLSLDRPAGTLSGGEAQRTKMIRHLGSSLTDVTYVFDEPTIGLHPHDIERMNDLLLQLRDKGNTVLVVEHKPETIAIADHVVDLGPGAGTAGGTVCFEGTVEGLRGSDTITGRHLDDRAALKDVGAHAVRRAGGPRRVDAQPAGRRRRHPARRALRGHRRRRLRQELADPRLGRRPRRRGRRSTRARSAARGAATRRRTPDCSTRSARRSPRPTASSRRCSAPTPRAPARPATAPASSTPSWA